MTVIASRTPTPEQANPASAVSCTVAEYIVQQLLCESITTVFGVHGANVEDLYDAAVRAEGMTPVVAKHEFAAGAMADGVARITGRPAAVMTTSGGGAMNVVPALAESYDSRVPVLALIGTAPTTLVGRGAFQDMLSPPDTIDITGVMSAVAGSCSVVSEPAEVPAALATAIATLHRGQPAVVLLPKDVQRSALPAGADPGHHVRHTRPPHDEVRAELSRIADDLASVVRSGGRVVIWAGDEASVAGLGEQIAALAALLGADVVASPGGRDILADAEGNAGVTGVMGHPSAHRSVEQAELCLAIGCRMTMTDRAGLDDALGRIRVIHLGAEPPRSAQPVDHLSCGDLRGCLDALTDRIRESVATPPHRPPIEVTRLPVPAPRVDLDMQTAITEIGAALPPDTVVFADAGNAGAAAIHHLPFGRGRFVVALGMGGMGYALAAGVGTAIHSTTTGQPTRTVVIAGDGAFFMHGMEIHTAIEHNAPVTFVLLNNNAHGMCITREHLFFPNVPSINRFRPTDLAAGLDAMFPDLGVAHATDRSGLRSAAADLLSRHGPNCLVIDVDPDEIPPFAPLIPKGHS